MHVLYIVHWLIVKSILFCSVLSFFLSINMDKNKDENKTKTPMLRYANN